MKISRAGSMDWVALAGCHRPSCRVHPSRATARERVGPLVSRPVAWQQPVLMDTQGGGIVLQLLEELRVVDREEAPLST